MTGVKCHVGGLVPFPPGCITLMPHRSIIIWGAYAHFSRIALTSLCRGIGCEAIGRGVAKLATSGVLVYSMPRYRL